MVQTTLQGSKESVGFQKTSGFADPELRVCLGSGLRVLGFYPAPCMASTCLWSCHHSSGPCIGRTGLRVSGLP